MPHAAPRGRCWQDSCEGRRRGSCSQAARDLASRILSSGHGEAGRWKVLEGLRARESTGVLAVTSLTEEETFRLSKISQQEEG